MLKLWFLQRTMNKNYKSSNQNRIWCIYKDKSSNSSAVRSSYIQTNKNVPEKFQDNIYCLMIANKSMTITFQNKTLEKQYIIKYFILARFFKKKLQSPNYSPPIPRSGASTSGPPGPGDSFHNPSFTTANKQRKHMWY